MPVLAFAVLAAVFFLRLRSGADPAALPSVLIGKPVPSFVLPAVAGLTADGKPVPGLSSADLKGGVTSSTSGPRGARRARSSIRC